MITTETILLEIPDLQPAELDRWIAHQWIKPDGPPPYRFAEIDLARIRLIVELRDTLEIAEPAMPTVLSLLDQLYELRRQMLALNDALTIVPLALRAEVVKRLGRT